MYRRWVLAVVFAIAVGAIIPARSHEAVTPPDREAADATAPAPALGTVIDFELRDMTGKRVRAADLRGRWLLVFFGYTRCPDLCPTTLGEIAGALSQLGPLATRVRPVFVSIDPERDTPKALREYVQSFDTRILPLTGTAAELTKAAAACGAVFYKVPGPTPDDYTFAHNAILTLVGPEGGIVTRFSSDTSADDLAGALRRLVNPAAS
jgi:protein SCO1/2